MAQTQRNINRAEVSRAATLEDLKRIEVARNYKAGWAEAVVAAREHAVLRRAEIARKRASRTN